MVLSEKEVNESHLLVQIRDRRKTANPENICLIHENQCFRECVSCNFDALTVALCISGEANKKVARTKLCLFLIRYLRTCKVYLIDNTSCQRNIDNLI